MAYLQIDENNVIDTDALVLFAFNPETDETCLTYGNSVRMYYPTKVVFQLLCDIHEVRGNLLSMSRVIEYSANLDKIKKYYQDTYGGHKFIDLIKDPDKIIKQEENNRAYKEFAEKAAELNMLEQQQMTFNFNKKPKDVN